MRAVLGQLFFDVGGLRSSDPLQMQRRAAEQLEASLEYAAGGANTLLVLIESQRWIVRSHADIDTEALMRPIW